MKQEYIIIITCLALLFFLVWKEMKRPARANLTLRLIASVVAVLMLVGLIIPVNLSIEKQVSGFNEIVLLTAGSPTDIPSELNRLKKITTVSSKASQGVEFVPDLSIFLSHHRGEISSVHIFGYGIREHEWELLTRDSVAVSYQTPGLPEGIVQVNWPGAIQFGDQLSVQGTYHNTTKDSLKIVLSGLGTLLDSMMISADTSQHFQLTCQPGHTGNTLYEIQCMRGSMIISTDQVPVNILPVSRPHVLFLSSSPNFENKFLTSWLYRNNYPAAIRNTVSQEKYDQQFLNMQAIALKSLTPSLLENFDVLIADDKALSALTVAESASLKTQLNKGLGLILQTDSSISLSSFSRPFTYKKQAAQISSTRTLLLPGMGSKGRPLAAEQWFAIQQDPFAQPLITDEHQAVIASSRLYGEGRIILNTATSTYSWALAGNDDHYAAFWSLLINKAAREDQQENSWQQSTAFPTVDQPAGLVLKTASSRPPVIKTEAGELYTTQTPYLPDTWTATWWPVTQGWQTLSSTDTVSLYVFEKGDWSSTRASELISRNTMHAARQKSTLRKSNKEQQQTTRIPVFIFYIGLLAACSYLWWEGKNIIKLKRKN